MWSKGCVVVKFLKGHVCPKLDMCPLLGVQAREHFLQHPPWIGMTTFIYPS